MTHRMLCTAFFVLTAAVAAHAADAGAVKLTQQENRITIEIGGQPFGDYYFGPEGGRAYVRPFLWPVRAADGTIVTSDQSQAVPSKPGEKIDHPHHRSLWVGHGDVNGADHWALKGADTPKQRHDGFDKIDGDTLVEKLTWEGKAHDPILAEQRTLRFFAYPDGARGIDVTSVFTPLDAPVTFGDTKEAGLCSVRVAGPIAKTSTLTESTGLVSTQPSDEKIVWGKKADWCDISGTIDGKPYGVAILDGPSNPRHPSNWHVRHYGLLAPNIFGLSAFDKNVPKDAGNLTMTKDKPTTFSYRVVIHVGDAKAAGLEQKYAELAGGKGQ
jgi:hypothetical protein